MIIPSAPKKLRRRFSAALLVLLALITVALTCAHSALCIESPSAPADVIILLGGEAQRRPIHAAKIFKQGVADTIVVTGYGDAEINKQTLVAAGVPASAIRLETNATSTAENSRFTVPLLSDEKARTAVIVTDWFHSRRALSSFEKFSPGIQFRSDPVHPKPGDPQRTKLEKAKVILIEYAKIAWYIVRHQILPW